MSTKVFKIGERAAYGIWKVTISKTKVLVQGIDWNTKHVEDSKIFNIPSNSFGQDSFIKSIRDYLLEQMDFYHMEKITDFIESKLFKKLD
jgi:DNA-binding transcriptional regulator GbsR (MarR family)